VCPELGPWYSFWPPHPLTRPGCRCMIRTVWAEPAAVSTFRVVQATLLCSPELTASRDPSGARLSQKPSALGHLYAIEMQDSPTISFATVTVRNWIPLCETCFWDATPPWMPGESDSAKRVNGRVQNHNRCAASLRERDRRWMPSVRKAISRRHTRSSALQWRVRHAIPGKVHRTLPQGRKRKSEPKQLTLCALATFA
jgi:hypothetical protein